MSPMFKIAKRAPTSPARSRVIPRMKREPWALVQSPRLAVNVNDRMLTFAIIAQVSTAGDDHRENGCPAHRSRGRAQLCGDPNPGQGTAASPNCSDEALRSI